MQKYTMQRYPVNLESILAILADPDSGAFFVLFFPVSGIFRR